MSNLKVITIEGTTNSALYDLTVDIPEGGTLVLKQARFEITYTGDSYPRIVNVGVGNVVSTNYVIDNDAGYNYFKVPLDQNLYTMADTTKRVISFTYPDAGFQMSGRLDKNCRVVLFDNNHTPLPNLVYYCLQFVVI